MRKLRGLKDLFGFLYVEDFASLFLDFLHASMHGCYCIGHFSWALRELDWIFWARNGGIDAEKKLELVRHNRWSWDVKPSWTAKRIPLSPMELRAQRTRFLDEQ